jgi:hypothetical protein
MVDNVSANSNDGLGATFKTDDDAGVHVPVTKIELGDNNTFDGYVSSSNPMPVSGTITANLSATDNAVLDQLELNTSYGDIVGGGTETGALRVTIASDSTGVITVDDGGGSITVDGTVTANLSATDNAVLDVIASAVHAEDAAHVTGDFGVQSLAVRNDADTSLADTTGDYTPLQVDANGYLKVNIKAGAGSGGTASTDDAAFTAGSGSGTPMMAFATSDTVDSGDVGVLAMDTNRNLKVSIEADSVGIGGGTQYTEDAAAAADPVGNMAMAVRADSLAAVTSTDGDNIALRATNNGELYVKQTDAVPITDNGGSLTVDGSVTVSGTVTADLSATDNAVLDQIELNTSYGDIVGGGVEASALRVTIANDSTGVLSIDDNGGSITVDGTVTANLSATDNAVLDQIELNTSYGDILGGGVEAGALRVTLASDSTGLLSVDDNGGSLTVDNADITTIAGAVSGTEMQVDIVAPLPAGTNAIGTLAANSGVDIGDVDVTSIIPGTGATNLGKAEDAAHSSGDVGVMALAVRKDTQGSSSGTDGDYEALQTDAYGALRVTNVDPSGRFDTFGRMITVTPNNDIDIQFFRAAPDVLVKVTTANSATATQNTGGALFASSTNANGSVQGVTNQKTVYRSGSEIYCMFTASFTAGIANSFMRLGLYDANNGFFIGYEGTSFGVTYRNNTTDTTVAKGSFSVDTLTGAAGSKFTRAGAPEAIDLTKLNVFRLRFGWLGSAPAVWEVLSPDGFWVKFHETLFPNLQAGPSIENADLPVTIDITKTAAAATDLQIQTDCWGAGATLTEQSGYVDSLNSRFSSTLSAGTSWNASGPWVDVHRYSLSKILIYSSTNNASGTLQVEFSMDGSTVHRTINYTVDNANAHEPHVVIPVAQFMRVSYDADAGGGNNHANFTVQTIHNINANKLPTSKVTTPIGNSTDVDNVRAVLVGENPAAGGSYVNVKVDANGQLQVDIAADSVGLSTEATLSNVQTAVELIDDAVYIDDADWTATTSKHVLTGGVYVSGGRTITDGDTAPISLDVNGHTITSAHGASVALADGISNTVNLLVDHDDAFLATANVNYWFNGSTWDRAKGDATDGLLVNLGSNNDVTVSGTVTANLSATDNAVLDSIQAAAEKSSTLYKNLDVDESEDQIKGTAGKIHWIHAINLTASPLYLKFYNATAASVTVGTTTPDLTFPVPTAGDTNGAGFTLPIPVGGIDFTTAITVACTTGLADNDSGAPAANALVLNLGYS